MRYVFRPLLIVLFAVLPMTSHGQDWPAFRGSDGTGSANPGGILAGARNIDLKVRWKKDIGSGYSSVVVAGDCVVTCYSDGDRDNIVCLDKKTGEQKWIGELGPSFKGENGSFDGPITTPLIHNGLVYALDPSGRLACLRLEDGTEVWTRHLVDNFGSVKPLYGFATSPIIVDDTLILQTGVKEKSLAGLDPNTGETRWAVSNDSINSQTPVAIRFFDRNIVLAAGGKNLTGVDPANGNVLFEFEHQGGNGSAVTPVPIGNNRVVMTLDDMFSKAVSLRPGNEDKIEVSEEWQDRSIKNTYNVPALWGGNLFAYSTRILTCVDPETGKAIWKSREPGDGFLITIDGHLIINTKQGGLHIGKASPEGYEEVAYLELFDDLCWSLPAYSDNAIFCRNLKEIACVDIVATEPVGATESTETGLMGSGFRDFFSQVQAATGADAKKQIVDEFLSAQPSFPIIEDGMVHFIYRGPGEDIAVASDIFGARQEVKMTRLDGTDLFFHAVPLESDQRANYMYLVDYQPQTDPHNDRSITSSVYAGEMEFAVRLRSEKPLEMSWFGMSDWREPEYLARIPEEMAGSIVSKQFESEILENGFNCQVYLPPGYEENTETRYRTIYVFALPGGRQLGQLDEAVDNVFRGEQPEVDPAILVYAGFPPTPDGNRAFVEELIPAIDQTWRTMADRKSRTTAGFGFAAGAAIGLAARHSDLFCGAAVYSPLVFDAEKAMIVAALEKLTNPVEIYVDWGRFDMFNPHENWDIRDISKELFELCEKTENVTARGGMVNDSTDWSSWRNRYIEFLKIGQQ